MHVCLVPVTSSDKEQKTKPTQHSIRELRGLGLSADVIICRSADPLGEKVRRPSPACVCFGAWPPRRGDSAAAILGQKCWTQSPGH